MDFSNYRRNLENDNMPDINLMEAKRSTKRSKFICMIHAYIRDTIKGHNVQIRHTPSEKLKAYFHKSIGNRKVRKNARNDRCTRDMQCGKGYHAVKPHACLRTCERIIHESPYKERGKERQESSDSVSHII